MAASAVALAVVSPHARDAFAVLSAQDDPAELSDVRLNSALRNSQKIVIENIEAALAAGDADLAHSFVELASERNVALDEALSRRVSDAVAGRGALLLAAGAFDLSLWVFGALFALFSLLASIKATTERLTQSWLIRKKARRLRRQMAAQPVLALTGAAGP